MTLNVSAYGDGALIVDLENLPAVHALRGAVLDAVARGSLSGVLDVVPGYRTLLITVEKEPGLVAAELRRLEPSRDEAPAGRLVELSVVYDGPDLAEVCDLTGLEGAEVVDRHTRVDYLVAFLGFTPGFPYLIGLDPALRVPRRPTPRTRVPAGAVGLAGDQTGVYPRESPGGWRLIGRTDAVLFDPVREPPALLAPGDRLRFVPV